MKLQFKEQAFQLEAVKAVIDCFAGQNPKTNRFTLERSRELLKKAQDAAKGLGDLYENEIKEEIGYRNSLIEITESQQLENIKQVQRNQDLIESIKIERPQGIKSGLNLTIEMETGTGKTYTYIRTMYELHKHYGWSKFIVIVPSIAIREGIHKSFEVTQEHFQGIYGHKISPFIYNSSRPQDIETFASDSRISVMIINTQAFNARGADARRIYMELDQFASRRPIEIIAQTNPIIIIDEPQSVDGEQTLQSMQDFNPLFTLRYSATHKTDYNKIYRLDALDAYNKKLVKKISAKGITFKGTSGTNGYLYVEQILLSTTKPPMVLLEYEKRTNSGVKRVREKLSKGANLHELSGYMPQYEHFTIQEIDGFFNKIEINGQEIFVGEAKGDVNENDFRRIQIRETIKSHLQKERNLFYQGIKVLSLFFIDSVEKYRVYGEQGEEKLGEYAQLFEEEYRNAVLDVIDLFTQEYGQYLDDNEPNKVHKGYMPTDAYLEYLQRDQAEKVHQGYFSIDKKKQLVDPSTKRAKKGEEAESDDISAYDLIMKDKERLLSFEEPTRFIFSHSALKEGWDNPNVFQICALKHVESGSQIRRRQEVGRGMRLCVNRHGIRQDFETIGEQVHEVNKLTIIASESYEDFAKGLQNEIAASLKDRPQKANIEFFVNKMLINATGESMRVDKELANKLNKFLFKHDILDDDDKITAEGKALIAANKVPLPETLEVYRDSITRLLQSVYSGEVPKPSDDRQTTEAKVNANFAKQEFQELWNRISLKSVYEVQIDTEKLVHDSKVFINAKLHISDRSYEVKEGTLKEASKEELEKLQGFGNVTRNTEKLRTNVNTNATYDIVGEIVAKTNLTRRTVVEILKKIEPNKFILIQKNPEEFISACSKLINEVKASLILNNIVYHKTEERHDAKTVFSNNKQVVIQSEMLKKHIYDYMTTDSQVEAEFAKDLEGSTLVTVYAKLPKSFYITTPIANYSPDWAIVFDKEKVRHIYFVAETKGTDSMTELREIEKLKLHCAEEHFKAISDGVVKFSQISSYDKLLEIIQLN
ncbi:MULTISPECIES: type III restriction-modification system endonuclease [Emticicia]|uniref:type III restriction-modification system endonuclease n=1 Tax=Emticicia TaxID=312278 RepID=UPI0007D89B30|nr:MULTISPECIES: DEAD/DEAH box helicase family protein [Emticicia]